jgi:UDP-glucose 4-epimerase
MRVMITGGAGFIGSHVAEALLVQGHHVAVLDNLSTGRRENVPAGATLQEIDLRDAPAVARATAEFRPDVICHHAAQSSVSVSTREPRLDAEVNILGSINLLLAAVESRVRRIVFASTGGAIYGEVPEGGRAALGASPAPASPYAASKLAAEGYMEVFRREHGLAYTVLRYSNVYGPRQDPHGEAGVVAVFCRRLLDGDPVTINAAAMPGDPGCTRDYVFVDDVVAANLKAIRGEMASRIVNVCSGVGARTLDLAESLRTAACSLSEIRFGPRRAGDLQRSVMEPHPEAPALVPLADGLERTMDWFRRAGSQPAGATSTAG